MNALHQSLVALCPTCESPFHFVQTIFQMVNDEGGWVVTCSGCGKEFKFPVRNPYESTTNELWRVRQIDDWPGNETDVPIATELVFHNFPLTKLNWKFDVAATALFRCERIAEDLDAAAYFQLHAERDRLECQWRDSENWLLARGTGGGGSDKILVCLDVPCGCGIPHRATFYAPTFLGASATPLANRCLLIHVESASLEERLNCLASKTEAMELLEKLLIRWHITSDQIVLATPFVGHQYMESEDVLAVWEWLFRNADPDKVTMITRKATWTKFRKAHDKSGVPFADLERYGLQAEVVTAGGTKQDFHAKFFAGVALDGVELLSGSANLVRGPSIENISFHKMSAVRFTKKYLDILNKPIPQVVPRQRLRSALLLSDNKWSFTVLPIEPWLSSPSP